MVTNNSIKEETKEIPKSSIKKDSKQDSRKSSIKQQNLNKNNILVEPDKQEEVK